MEYTNEELRKQNLELKEKIIKNNSFLKTVAEMIGIETDGLGYDGLQLSLDDFADKINEMRALANER